MRNISVRWQAPWLFPVMPSVKRPWCWERLKAGREGDHRGWDGWMASPTQWPWVWASSESWWWTGRPGMLRSMGSQRVGHDSNWTATILNDGLKLSSWWSHSLSDHHMAERRMDINWGVFISNSLVQMCHFPLKRAVCRVYWSPAAGVSGFGWALWTLCGWDCHSPSWCLCIASKDANTVMPDSGFTLCLS